MTLASRISVVALQPLFERKGTVPPAAVRFWSGRSDFHLVRVDCRLGLASAAPVQSVRIALEFDPHMRMEVRRAAAHSIFPRDEWRQYGAAEVQFGLRPDLTFWVPKTADGLPFVRARDVERALRNRLFIGPMKTSFRRFGVSGRTAGNSRAEWEVRAAMPLKSGTFRLWMVLRVPRQKTRTLVNAALEAEVRLPRVLSPLVGRRRLIRAARKWQWTMAPAGFAPGARTVSAGLRARRRRR